MSGLSRRQFAAEIGMSVGYVQKLVDTGRCILTADGKIDGPASRARIAETQGGRPDVAERFAAQRQPAAAPHQTLTQACEASAPSRRGLPSGGMVRM
mgnify:CR=1 FL=1